MPGEKFGGHCHLVIKILKWIPVIFITLIIFWSYYAYVYQLCTLTIESTYEQVIYIVIYHVLFVMILWSYFQTIFTEKRKVPESFKVPEMDLELMITADSADIQHQILENLAKKLPITNININGSVRFCDKCKHIKPDRAHHCSVCGECVLKMDHHCPWINNCVSFTNYKFFVLFLGYALAYCVFIILTTLSYFIAFWRGELAGTSKFHILFLFFVAIMFGISLVSLFVYHCYLISENRTTLEAFRAPIFKRIGADKNGFHLGCCRNFQEVFGERALLWFMPVSSSFGDGISFPRFTVLEERESLLRASGEPSP